MIPPPARFFPASPPSESPAPGLRARNLQPAVLTPNHGRTPRPSLPPAPSLCRIRPDAGGGAVVDVRSASRVGKGDLGCNAARIRALLAALRAELGM